MKLDKDNPRLTAYVLDALSPREKARIEKALEADPALRAEVEEIRRASAWMHEAASAGAASPLLLDDARRAEVDRAIAARARAERSASRQPAPLPWWVRVFPPQQWAPVGTALLVLGIGYIAFKDVTVFEGRPPREGMSVRFEEKAAEDVTEMEMLIEEEPLPEIGGGGGKMITMFGSAAAPSAETPPPSAPQPELNDLLTTNTSTPAPSFSMPRKPTTLQGGVLGGRDEAASPVAGPEREETQVASASGKMRPLTTGIPKEQIEGTPMPIRLPQRTPGRADAVRSLESTEIASRTEKAKGDSSSLLSRRRDSDISKKSTESRYADRFIAPDEPVVRPQAPGNEGYAAIEELGFTRIKDAETATSTFSADVDTASYSNVRRFLNQGQLPPADAVRIEELVNYFTYDYPEPKGKHPFAADVEIARCPWQPKHRLARIGIRAVRPDADERPALNLVFLIDVSGSMRPENKLPLLVRSLKTLTGNLRDDDRVAIVTYAGNSGLVLDSTPVSDRQKILEALDNLRSGGSTAGAAGIKLAYQVAREHADEEAMNRVILCTDGDFNVGTTDNDELLSLIRARKNDGIFLNIYGFGMGNIKDDRLEKLSNEGNGTYGYIDSYPEAQKIFGQQLDGTLTTVAKDVKFQLEFNPRAVAAYRLVGYENRMLAREDFNDDTKDAGEVGAGHTVTALYEIVPVGVEGTVGDVDPHRYIEEGQSGDKKTSLWTKLTGGREEELFFLKIRYKQPDADVSQLMTQPVKDSDRNASQASGDYRFAAAVAGFGQLLRGSRYSGPIEWEEVIELARSGRGDDPHGHRAEFIRLAQAARELQE